ncbi:MAG: hypothetical protein R3A51_23870, partial [Nannocystaceae bacterium]
MPRSRAPRTARALACALALSACAVDDDTPKQPQSADEQPQPQPRPPPTPQANPIATPPPNPTPNPTPTEPPVSALAAPKVVDVKTFKIKADDANVPETTHSFASGGDIKWILGAASPSPAWSFDSKQLAYHDGNCVSVVDADANFVKSLRLPAKKPRKAVIELGAGWEGGTCSGPAWSHDNTQIAVGHGFHGPATVFDVARGKTREYKFGDSGLWSVSFAPDDSAIVGRVHQSGVALMRTRGKSERAVIVSDAEPSMGGYFPTLSPDGRFYARVMDFSAPALELAAFSPGTATKTKVADPWEEKVKHPGLVATRKALIDGPIPEFAFSSTGDRIVAVRGDMYKGYDNYVYPDGQLIVIAVPSGEI